MFFAIPCQSQEVHKWIDQQGFIHLDKKLPSNTKTISNVASVEVTEECERLTSLARGKFEAAKLHKLQLIANKVAMEEFKQDSRRDAVSYKANRKLQAKNGITDLEYNRVLEQAYEMLKMSNIAYKVAPTETQ
jgi:hypothetical protein